MVCDWCVLFVLVVFCLIGLLYIILVRFAFWFGFVGAGVSLLVFWIVGILMVWILYVWVGWCVIVGGLVGLCSCCFGYFGFGCCLLWVV